ncbi:MAG: class I SAM-dependent methyltransferase [Myxococcota bacterium]
MSEHSSPSQGVPIGALFDDFAADYLDVRDAVGWSPWPHIEDALGDAHVPLTGQRILDVGCGGGSVMEALAQRGAQVVGVDASEQMCALAAERLPTAPLHWRNLEQGLPWPDHSFDATLALGCLEFVAAIEEACLELIRVTRPGGRLLYVVEICGPHVDGGEAKAVTLYETWTRYRRPLADVRAFAQHHLVEVEVIEIPGYVQDDSGLLVKYARVIGQVPA